jgi:hypothetical protein
MKKTILTFGLFTLVLASTSFAAPTTSTAAIADNTVTASIDGNGNQDAGGNRKVDFLGNEIIKTSTTHGNGIDGNGNQDAGGNRKVD